MKVYDLMMVLAKVSPYAEVGCLWDEAAADINSVFIDTTGALIIDCSSYASFDIRHQDARKA